MVLHDTKLHKNDNCLTYVFKRVGFKTKIRFAKEIPKENIYPYLIDELKVGDIVVWKYRKQYHLWDTEIKTLNGKPVLIKNNEFTGLHFAVVENIEDLGIDNKIITISECVRNDNSYSFPTIKIATITHNDRVGDTEVRVPTYKLNYNDIKL